jgi:hypothetical protein
MRPKLRWACLVSLVLLRLILGPMGLGFRVINKCNSIFELLVIDFTFSFALKKNPNIILKPIFWMTYIAPLICRVISTRGKKKRHFLKCMLEVFTPIGEVLGLAIHSFFFSGWGINPECPNCCPFVIFETVLLYIGVQGSSPFFNKASSTTLNPKP